MLVGYARVSTQDQNLDLQRDALNKEICQTLQISEATFYRYTTQGSKNL